MLVFSVLVVRVVVGSGCNLCLRQPACLPVRASKRLWLCLCLCLCCGCTYGCALACSFDGTVVVCVAVVTVLILAMAVAVAVIDCGGEASKERSEVGRRCLECCSGIV